MLSDGRRVPNPAPLQQAQRRLRRLNRQLARRRGPLAPDGRRQTPSVGWQQTSRQLARAHARIANLRRDGLHQLTSTLAGTYGIVVVEHLNVAGMLRNRRLARRIADAGWGELRRQLGYKTAWAGGILVEADTFSPPWCRRGRGWSPGVARRPQTLGERTEDPAWPGRPR